MALMCRGDIVPGHRSLIDVGQKFTVLGECFDHLAIAAQTQLGQHQVHHGLAKRSGAGMATNDGLEMLHRRFVVAEFEIQIAGQPRRFRPDQRVFDS